MKRFLLIFLAIALCLCACSTPEPDEPVGDGTGPQGNVSTTEGTPDPTDPNGDSTIPSGGESTDGNTEEPSQTPEDSTAQLPDGSTVTVPTVTVPHDPDGPTPSQSGGTQGTTSGQVGGTTKPNPSIGGTTKPNPSVSGTTKPQPSASGTTKTTVSTQKTTSSKKPIFTTSKSKSTTGKTTTNPTTNPTIHLEASEMAFYQNIVDTENAWLASIQLSNGAMPMTPTTNGTVKVTPYFSDFAALSLLNQADKYASHVKKYMDWHFSHLNTAKTDYNGVDGTIYDYNVTVSGGKVTGEAILMSGGKKSYDSTDSYAATFLMVLQKYVEKTGDKAYIIAHKSEIERIVGAMFATMKGGLTLAKPDYAIKYLMDNCEVYEGMLAGEKLYTDVLIPAGAGSTATRDKLKKGARQVADKIEEEMWNGSFYHPALGADSSVAYTFNWSNFYPSATSQMFPILFGLIDPSGDRAQSLYNSFCQYYDWENFNIPDTFYWGSNVQAAAMMGDLGRVKTYMTYYEKIMKRHAYPLYNADAAKVCMAAYDILQMAD